MRAAAPCLLIALACGCGSRTGLGLPEATLAVDAGIDLGVDAFTAPEVTPVETSPECASIAERIAGRVVPAQGACTAVVRISRDDVITGYHLFCGAHRGIDEASARKQSVVDTGVGLMGCFTSPSASGSTPTDDFVFVQPASAAACACCGDGWFTAVGARNALTVLGGAITFGPGRGLVFPSSFDPSSDLGLDCASSLPVVAGRGWDLTNEQSPSSPPPALDAATVQSRLRIVWRTALPDGLARKHHLFDAVVLKYAPQATSTVDEEWIVMLNSGWLEVD